MAANTLREKLLGQLPFAYFSEQQFIPAQQKMISQATDPALKAGLEKHLEETKQHAVNLEKVFVALGHKPETKECPICLGLVKSGDTAMKEAGNDAVRDVSIGGAAALVEHYEIGVYRGLIAQAEALGQADVVQLLQQNLAQEENAVAKLESAAPMMMQKAAA